MKNIKLLIIWTCLLFFYQITYAQQTTLEGQAITIDKNMYDALSEWASKGERQKVPMKDFLESKFDRIKVAKFLKEFNDNGDSRNQNCTCNVVVPNAVFDLSPNNLEVDNFNGHDEDGCFLCPNPEWWRTDSRTRHGAAHQDDLDLRGYHTSEGYSRITSSSDNASSTHTRFELNYICTSGGFPTGCGCEKEIDMRTKYESSLRVYTRVGGAWSRGAKASVEDWAAIISYDWNANSDNLIANAQIHNAGHKGISGTQSATWNPTAFVNILKLAKSIGKVILGNGISASQLASLVSSLSNVISEPFVEHHNNGPNTQNDQLIVHSDATLSLLPNVRKTILIVSNGKVAASGWGGNWDAEARSSSAYSLALVLPFDDSNSNCCLERLAAWDTKRMANAPNTVSTYRSGIVSFLNTEHIPGLTWGNNPVTGVQNLGTNCSGYITSINTDNSGLSVSNGCLGGINPMLSDLIVLTTSAQIFNNPITNSSTLQAKCTIKNISPSCGGATAGSSKMRFYLSTDMNLDPNDTFLAERSIAPLTPYSKESEMYYMPIQQNPSGFYGYIIFVADYYNDVTEKNESNNSVSRLIFESPCNRPPCELMPLRQTVQPTEEEITQEINIRSYPNPFQNQSIIEYSLEKPTELTLTIFDVNGHVIEQITTNELKEEGTHKVKIDGSNWSSGVYLYVLQTPKDRKTGRMILNK